MYFVKCFGKVHHNYISLDVIALTEFHMILMIEIHVGGRTECCYFLSGPSYYCL